MQSAPLPPPVAPTAYRVADLRIDVTRRRVTRGGTEIALSNLSFELLLELTRAAPDILSFEQLMQRVWPRLVVGPETVSQRVKLVREALGDDADSPRYIAGVRGRGYRLIADVEPLVSTASPEPAPHSSATSAAMMQPAATIEPPATATTAAMTAAITSPMAPAVTPAMTPAPAVTPAMTPAPAMTPPMTPAMTPPMTLAVTPPMTPAMTPAMTPSMTPAAAAPTTPASTAAMTQPAPKSTKPSRSRTYGVAAVAAILLAGLLGYVALQRQRQVIVGGNFGTVEAPANKPGTAVVVAAPAPATSIAVLPFTDFSEDHNQEYFSDGLAGEVIDLLTRLPGLQVSAQTSSFSFKGRRTTIAEIGKALRVSNVLEGTVRKTRDRIRVTAQLVRADNGYVRWSNRYDRNPDDIFKVQDEIAGAVAGALNVELQAGRIGNRSAPPQIDAYTLALEGRYFLERHGPEDYEKATAYYQRAIDLDPRYAPAWAGYARATWMQGDLGSMSWDTARARARAAAERAVQLDPGLPEAHLIMSRMLANDLDWAASARELDAAVALDPGDANTLLTKAAWASLMAGKPDEAIGLAQQAVLRDPLTPTAHYRLCWIYFDAGRLTDAANACRESLELNSNFAGAHFTIASLLLAGGQPDAALVEIAREPDDAFRLRGLAIVQYHLGGHAQSDAALATLLQRYSTKRMLFIASVYAARNERDAAFAWLERARSHMEYQIYEVKSRPMFGQLRGDPRYNAFLRSVKLSE